MTYKEAKDAGYRLADAAYTRGYVSRKAYNIDSAEVYTAGGSRKGQLYILRPCFDSTRYCFRHYLVKED